MRPEEAVKQLEYVIDASTDEVGNRHAPMFGQTFERVASEGTGRDVATLADELGTAVREGARPGPSEANAAAERILRGDRVLTDGGE